MKVNNKRCCALIICVLSFLSLRSEDVPFHVEIATATKEYVYNYTKYTGLLSVRDESGSFRSGTIQFRVSDVKGGIAEKVTSDHTFSGKFKIDKRLLTLRVDDVNRTADEVMYDVMVALVSLQGLGVSVRMDETNFIHPEQIQLEIGTETIQIDMSNYFNNMMIGKNDTVNINSQKNYMSSISSKDSGKLILFMAGSESAVNIFSKSYHYYAESNLFSKNVVPADISKFEPLIPLDADNTYMLFSVSAIKESE